MKARPALNTDHHYQFATKYMAQDNSVQGQPLGARRV